MKKTSTLIALLILLWTANAFALDLSLATIKDIGFTDKFEYAVDIYAVSEEDDFEVGTTQLTISFNNSVLSNPTLSEQHPDFHDNANYNAMALVAVAANQTQLQITPSGAGTILPGTEIRLARITFTIDNTTYQTENAGIAWVTSGLVSFIGVVGDINSLLSLDSETLAGNTSLICRPTISGAVAPATSIAAGNAYSFIPTVDNGYGTLTFGITNPPTWAAFNTATGELSGTPTLSNVGTTSNIVIQVSDAYDAGGTVTFNIEVTAGCTAPTLSGTPPATAASGAAYTFTPTVSNGCGSLTYSIVNLPAWADFDTTTGTLSGTPVAADAAIYSGIVITVTDELSASASLPAFAIEVTDAGAGGDSGGGGGGGCFIATLR